MIECKKTVCNAENNRVELHKEGAASYTRHGRRISCMCASFSEKNSGLELHKEVQFQTD